MLEGKGESRKAQGKGRASPCNTESAFAELVGATGKGQFALPTCACDWVSFPSAEMSLTSLSDLSNPPTPLGHDALGQAIAQMLLMRVEPNSAMWPQENGKGGRLNAFILGHAE